MPIQNLSKVNIMSDLIENTQVAFKANTIGDEVKRVVLPFGGFYESDYAQLIRNELDRLKYDEGKTDQEIEVITSSIDGKAFYLTVADGFGDYLNECFSTVFGKSVEVAFNQIEYHPMTLQNTGDEISAAIDVTQLPGLNYLQHFCTTNDLMDFKDSLKQIAADKFSGPGLRSSWDANIEVLFEKPYEQWESVYIECLLTAMVQALSLNNNYKNNGYWAIAVREFEATDFMEYGRANGLFCIDL